MTAATQRRQTPQEIFTAIEQLEPDEAEQLARRLLQMQAQRKAQRKAQHLSVREEQLLQEIYREKRPGFTSRFDALNAKRRDLNLSPDEHAELLQLNDESEAFTVRRLQALAELALTQNAEPDLYDPYIYQFLKHVSTPNGWYSKFSCFTQIQKEAVLMVLKHILEHHISWIGDWNTEEDLLAGTIRWEEFVTKTASGNSLSSPADL